MTNRMPSASLALALVLVAALVAAGAASAQVKKVDELEYPPLPSFDIVQPERVVLDNGLVLLLLEDHERPLVSATALIRTGARLEPAGKVGLSDLVGEVWRTGGTEKRTGDELDDYLEDRAAFVETGIGTTSGSVSLSCLTADFPDVLGVFAEVLRHPLFDEEKIAVARKAIEAGIARQNDDPGQIIGREFAEVVYGADSPYAWTPTYATLGAVGRDDMLAWHGRYVHPERTIIGIQGDFDRGKVLEQVKAVLGDWPRGTGLEEKPAAYRTEPAPGVYVIEKSDMTQSEVKMGHLGITRDHPDYYAVQVMNEVLGGSFGARLFSNVRSKKGLAYSVRGSVGSAWDYPGLTTLSLSTKVETTGAGIEALLEEARNMSAKAPTDAEVARAKRGILNSFIFNFDSTAEILADALTYEYYGYPADWLTRYRKGIESVTTDQVREAARKHLRPDEFTIMVVGPIEGRDMPLESFGEVAQVDITIPEPAREELVVSAESLRRGSELVEQAVEAMGGAAVLDGLSALDMATTVVASTPQGEMELRARLVMVYPDRFRQEMTLPFGTMAMVFGPDGAFMETPQGTQILPDSQRIQLEKSVLRMPAVLLKHRGDEGFAAVALGEYDLEGTKLELVAVDFRDERTTLGIDPATGRVVRVSYLGSPMGGPPGDMVSRYSDFREVDGLTVAFESVTTFNGEPALQGQVGSLSVNPELDDGMFVKPPA